MTLTLWESGLKPSQDDGPGHLIGGIGEADRFLDWCEWASTTQGYSSLLSCRILSQVKCKRWGCKHCGPRKIASLAMRVKQASPSKLITLTVDPSLHRSPRDAYDTTRGRVAQLAVRLRRQFSEFEYLRVLEITKKGWPHYHLLVRSPYIPYALIHNIWRDLTGATIVDVRKLKRGDDVYFYVMKYLSKQTYIRWTHRRVSTSKKFFTHDCRPKGVNLELRDRHFSTDHPSEVLAQMWKGQTIQKLNRDVVVASKNFLTARFVYEIKKEEQEV